MSKNRNGAPPSLGPPFGGRPSPVLAVFRRFPSQRESVTRLYEHSDSFRELCEDYRDSVEALGRLQTSRRPQDLRLQEEYRALCLRLECEMLRYLEGSLRESPRERESP